jgi:hypothetical protein
MLNWREYKGLLWSLAGNVLLAGAVAWVLARQPTATASMSKTALGNSPASKAGFDWTAIRSDDYAVYAENLRALGCPEASIVDIIVGEVTASYAAKVRAEAAEPQWKYWETAAITAESEATRIRELRARLERERREVLQKALGPEALQAMAKYRLWNDVDADAQLLAFLPANKRQQLHAIVAKYTQAEPDNPALLTEEAVRRAAASKAQQRAEIAALLSAQELENLDLRKSETAERLRQELRGFQSTEAEFKQLFRVRRSYEATLAANTDVRDPNVLQVRIEAERRFAEEARAALGEERYQDYQRARDTDYQNALQLTQFFSLPDETAARVYDLKRDVDARAGGINANTALSEQRRGELLAQIQINTESTLQSLLGSEVLQEYRRNNRWWIWSD